VQKRTRAQGNEVELGAERGEEMMDANAERWADLSGLYAKYHQTAKDESLQAAVMAKALRAQLAAYLGGQSDSVLMFDYDESTSAYTEESNPFKAVSMNGEYKWYLGYGVTLERLPNAWPKTNFQFPVWFTFGEVLTVDTSFGIVEIPSDSTKGIDFSPACEKIYQGIRESLIARATKTQGNKNFGFVEFGPERG
jgi:hypothetical protein